MSDLRRQKVGIMVRTVALGRSPECARELLELAHDVETREVATKEWLDRFEDISERHGIPLMVPPSHIGRIILPVASLVRAAAVARGDFTPADEAFYQAMCRISQPFKTRAERDEALREFDRTLETAHHLRHAVPGVQ